MPVRYRDCEWCGFTFAAKNIRARFCKDAHRAAAGRAARNEAALLLPDPGVPAPKAKLSPLEQMDGVTSLEQLVQLVAEQLTGGTATEAPVVDDETSQPYEAQPGPHEAATRADLTAAGRIHTSLGVSTIGLAFRLDNAHGETGSAYAALARGHRESLAAALSRANSVDPSVAGSGDAEETPVASVDPLEAARRERERRRALGA